MARGHPPPHCENTQVLREAITENDEDDDVDDDNFIHGHTNMYNWIRIVLLQLLLWVQGFTTVYN